jgi:hypothetical protein
MPWRLGFSAVTPANAGVSESLAHYARRSRDAPGMTFLTHPPKPKITFFSNLNRTVTFRGYVVGYSAKNK